jgi:hypothetical protein
MGITFLPCKNCGKLNHEDDIQRINGCECESLICVWCFEYYCDPEFIQKIRNNEEEEETFCETCVFCEKENDAKQAVIKLKELHNKLFHKKRISNKLYVELIRCTNKL